MEQSFATLNLGPVEAGGFAAIILAGALAVVILRVMWISNRRTVAIRKTDDEPTNHAR